MDTEIKKKARELHMEFAESRGLDATYCPSEVARKLAPGHWRNMMDLVRAVADQLIVEDKLVVMQNGRIIDKNATNAQGPIRLRKKD